MARPRISVVTPSFCSEATIARTLESVYLQTYDKIEYILIDGGSTDRTVEIAESWREKMEARGISFRLVSEQDRGIYDAMNKGIRMATGELVGIINSDDWYEPCALTRAAEVFQEENYDMFYADLQIWTQTSDTDPDALEKRLVKHSRMRKRLVVSRDWNHPTTFITKKVYDRFQYKLESLHDDWDLVLRIRKAGLKIVIRNEILANFRMGGASNEKKLSKCLARGKARYRIYRNNGYSRLYWFECVLIEAVKWILG